ncbi:hypothetical protein GSI_08123 [Ganoderma sinense ZZ0214-1]|uniref:Uncharacterized protein n=1 Tax=Ganoderma sinense ZZ0214-1 TaxID=1077348 RepID=A0A2G8S7G2_9APHY|nr:hypothetical protein GSI_08123 [Ganoderma sinense ZZ0214-1]
MLVAFASVTRPVCEVVEIQAEFERPGYELIGTGIAWLGMTPLRVLAPPGALLFDARLAPSVVESLVVEALVSSASLHHDGVQALVISPDSQWVASGSMGSTIVLWDAATGVVLHRWGPHSYKPVRSLTFSPNGQYLLSGGDNGKATIWEVRRNLGADKVTNLNFEGYIGPVLTFAWSPDGGTIVTGSDDGTARLWDTRTMTYCQRAFCQLKGPVVCLAFFPDESCLSCGSNRGVCCIVNVASGSLHRYLWNSPSDSQDAENNDDDDDDTDSGGSRQTPHQMRDTIAAFDPSNGSTHLATALCGSCSGINTVDAVAGSVLAHIGGKRGELTRIATSPSRQMGRLSSEYPQRVQVREADCMSGMQLLASNASSSLDAQTVTPC